MSFIIDTCVVSELYKKAPEKNVLDWFQNCPEDQIYMSSLALGEIQYGIEMLPHSKKKNNLMVWFDEFQETYRGYTLPVNDNICMRWGNEGAKLQKKGMDFFIYNRWIDCLYCY